jgi:hypothetical protein
MSDLPVVSMQDTEASVLDENEELAAASNQGVAVSSLISEMSDHISYDVIQSTTHEERLSAMSGVCRLNDLLKEFSTQARREASHDHEELATLITWKNSEYAVFNT